MSAYTDQRLAEIRAQGAATARHHKSPIPKQLDLPRKPIMTTAYAENITIKLGLHGDGCGHTIVFTDEHYKACKETGRTFHCTVCGNTRVFSGKNTVDQLRGELAAAKQREETERHLRQQAQSAERVIQDLLKKERASKARLKKRADHGVCPCCTRSFENVRRHLATKHPEYVKS